MSKRIAPKKSSEAFLRMHVSYPHDCCLPWPFRLTQMGRGLAVVGGIQKQAHRWMCLLAHGEAPSPAHQAAHSCGHGWCVNPRHLRWATPKENCADKIIHGTTNRGERSGKTRLTQADIQAIRSAPPDLKSLMERYGVSKGCVSKIRSGQRWHAGAA